MSIPETQLAPTNGAHAIAEQGSRSRDIPLTGIGNLTISNVDDAIKISAMLAASRLYGAKTKEQAFAILLTGIDLGLSPTAALSGIYVVNDRPTLGADTMLALCRQRPGICKYFRMIENTDERATFETWREGDPEPQAHTYTMADAQKARLTSKDNWQKHPKNMLRARCIAELCRIVYPDVIKGMYTPDEIDHLAPAPTVAEAPAVPTRTDQVKAMLAKPGPAVASIPADEIPPEDRAPDTEPTQEIDPFADAADVDADLCLECSNPLTPERKAWLDEHPAAPRICGTCQGLSASQPEQDALFSDEPVGAAADRAPMKGGKR